MSLRNKSTLLISLLICKEVSEWALPKEKINFLEAKQNIIIWRVKCEDANDGDKKIQCYDNFMFRKISLERIDLIMITFCL